MKVISVLFYILLIFNCSAQNQYPQSKDNLFEGMNGISGITDDWDILYPQPTNGTLDGLEVIGDTIIVSGYENKWPGITAIILLSTDKGTTWTVYKPEQNVTFYKFYFSGNTLYGNGYKLGFGTMFYGVICKSTDFGKSWTTLKEHDGGYFSLNVLGNELIATVVDTARITNYFSTDGGSNWTSNTFQIPDYYQGFRISFGSTDTAWMSYYNTNNQTRLFRSTDKGVSWNEQFINGTGIFVLKAFSSQLLYAFCSSKLFKSSDGGVNWTVLHEWTNEYSHSLFFFDSSGNFFITFFKSTNPGYVMENYISTDWGNTWSSFSSPVNHEMFNQQKYTSEGLWIAGYYGDLLFKGNSGEWEPKTKKFTNYKLTGITFTSGNNGYACNERGSIYKSSDGETFKEIYKNTEPYLFYDIQAVTDDIVFTSRSISSTSSVIMRSTNGGTSWTSAQIDSLKAGKIFFQDLNNGWATTSSEVVPYGYPVLLRTTNAGKSWEKVYCTDVTTVFGEIRDITFGNADDGWAVGKAGIVMKTSDGGNEWKLAWGNLDPNDFWLKTDLYGVKAFDENRIMITGTFYGDSSYSVIISTTDKGITWETSYLGKYYNYKTNIYFRSPMEGWIFGQFVYKTTDGGTSWSFVENLQGIEDYSAFGKWVWAVGEGGTVYKKTFTTVNVEGEKHTTSPTKFELYQNYPNPFNPTTNIRFDIKDKGNAVLKIYDILGRKVLNENLGVLSPGTHNYTFDGSSLANGVYIYRLELNSSSLTRKMVLMK